MSFDKFALGGFFICVICGILAGLGSCTITAQQELEIIKAAAAAGLEQRVVRVEGFGVHTIWVKPGAKDLLYIGSSKVTVERAAE